VKEPIKLKTSKGLFSRILLSENVVPLGISQKNFKQRTLRGTKGYYYVLFCIIDLNFNCQSFCIISWPMKDLLSLITAADFEIEFMICSSTLFIVVFQLNEAVRTYPTGTTNGCDGLSMSSTYFFPICCPTAKPLLLSCGK
jgi:hypothetical protein